MMPTNDELVDKDDGENYAVRAFLALYGSGRASLTVGNMREHLISSGFAAHWPAWVDHEAMAHLTKGGAQEWIRHLFALEPRARAAADAREPVAWLHTRTDTGATAILNGRTPYHIQGWTAIPLYVGGVSVAAQTMEPTQIRVHNGRDGAWVEFWTQSGKSFCFQPVQQWPLTDEFAAVVHEWARDQAAMSAAPSPDAGAVQEQAGDDDGMADSPPPGPIRDAMIDAVARQIDADMTTPNAAPTLCPHGRDREQVNCYACIRAESDAWTAAPSICSAHRYRIVGCPECYPSLVVRTAAATADEQMHPMGLRTDYGSQQWSMDALDALAQQQARIESLTAENLEWRKHCLQADSNATAQVRRAERAEADAKAAREDAERYRWLVANELVYLVEARRTKQDCIVGATEIYPGTHTNSLDAAIDAARAAIGEGEK